MAEKQESHKRSYLADRKMFIDQSCRRRYCRISRKAKARRKKDSRQYRFRHEEEIGRDPDSPEAIEKSQYPSFWQEAGDAPRSQRAENRRNAVNRKGPAGISSIYPIKDELGNALYFYHAQG